MSLYFLKNSLFSASTEKESVMSFKVIPFYTPKASQTSFGIAPFYFI